MIKTFAKKIVEKMGLEVNLKKNLWYKDAWKVQQRLLAGKKRPVIFDVGACDGDTVIKYKELFSNAIVHAFEPQPQPFKKLQSLENVYSDIHVNNLALSDGKGKAEFFLTEGYASSSLLPAARSGSFVDEHTVRKEMIEVDVDTLDEYARTRGIDYIDVLKMDVQGSEMNILKGATDLLQKDKIGIIYSEVWFKAAYEGQPYFEDITVFLRELHYRVQGFYDVTIDFKHDGQALWGDMIFIKSI